MSISTKSVIYIIDDDVVDRMAVRRALRRAIPNPIEEFSDGPSALEALDARPHTESVLLVDRNMPRMDGFEFLRASRERPWFVHARVFLLSASGESPDTPPDLEPLVHGVVDKDDPARWLGDPTAPAATRGGPRPGREETPG